MIRTFLILLLLATTATAQDLPALFNVTGVSANDSLNVRANPTTNAPVIGKLTHSAQNIEVVQTSQDGKWGQINIGETAGWTSMRYLTAQNPNSSWPPETLSCYGTEPFWNAEITPGSIQISNPSEQGQTLPIQSRQTSQNRTDRAALITSDASITLSRTLCNDGMSDRTFGITIDILRGTTLLSGCCTLTP